jgi:hypothetical protein
MNLTSSKVDLYRREKKIYFGELSTLPVLYRSDDFIKRQFLLSIGLSAIDWIDPSKYCQPILWALKIETFFVEDFLGREI